MTIDQLVERLQAVGIFWDGQRLTIPDPRATMRQIAVEVNPRPSRATAKYFAESLQEINRNRITPELVLVNTELDRKIFRHAMSYWSVPITYGIGRRMQYIIWDRGNNRVLGVFALSDAVVLLRLRNNLIGWTLETRKQRLFNLLNACILGAVPPYNELLGAKLVALLSGSDSVRAEFRRRYENRITYKQRVVKPPELVMVETMGAFGKSVIYNRLKGWQFVGYTIGYSNIHLKAGNLFHDILRAAERHPASGEFSQLIKRHKEEFPVNTLILLRSALKVLGIPQAFSQTPVVRGYYVYPLAHNYREYLRGETDTPDYIGLPEDELIRYWKERWLVKRLQR